MELNLLRGRQYADNLANDYTFNGESDFTNTVGTGTVIFDSNLSFEGNSCLRIQNDDIENDIVAASPTAQIITPRTGTYDFSVYLRKSTPLYVMSGIIRIFKGASEIGAETFSFGSETASEDVTDQWISFFTNQNYSLEKGDVITFTFQMDGKEFTETPISLYIDGFHFYNKERLQSEAPVYSIPIKVSTEIENRIVLNQSNIVTELASIDVTKQYFIDGDIDLGSTNIVVPSTDGKGIEINGLGKDISIIRSSQAGYTLFNSPVGGSGNITIANVSFQIDGIGSKLYDVTGDTGNEAIELTNVNFNDCSSLGEITNYRQGLEKNTGRFGGTPELTLSGVWLGGFVFETTIVRSLTDGVYSLFKAGVGFLMQSRFGSNANIDLPASASFIDFTPANFQNPSTLQLHGCIITRDGVQDASDTNIHPNISETDLESQFVSNLGIHNTFEGGQAVVSTEVETVIVTDGVFVDLAGTYTTSDLQHFDSPANGQLRHIGDNPTGYKVTFSGIIDGTANDEIIIKIVVWDDSASSFIDYKSVVRVINSLQGGRNVAYFNTIAFVILDKNDYVKIQVANDGATDNVTAELGTELIIEAR